VCFPVLIIDMPDFPLMDDGLTLTPFTNHILLDNAGQGPIKKGYMEQTVIVARDVFPPEITFIQIKLKHGGHFDAEKEI
jgi:hypothetical protein